MPETRPIAGFPGYFVGDDGSVWSARKHGRIASTMRPVTKHLRRKGNGYPFVVLRRDRSKGKTYSLYVHHLVLQAFVGPRPEKMEACHNDGDRSNSRLENLRWDTHKNNSADILKHGRRQQGTQKHNAKLTEADVPVIRQLAAGGVAKNEIARRFGVNDMTIQYLLIGRTWKHVP